MLTLTRHLVWPTFLAVIGLSICAGSADARSPAQRTDSRAGRGPSAVSVSVHSAPIVVPSIPTAPPTAQLASSCQPDWQPMFGGEQGVRGNVHAMVEFDDGSGSGLYVAGTFTSAGGLAVGCIAKWDGAEWSPLGSGIQGTSGNFGFYALAVFDDGSGPALYAGGRFQTAGGAPASNVARWDGASWSSLGGGTNDHVRALAVFDDGSGPALFAGGIFSSAGGVAASGVARWDGASWSPLGSGLTGSPAFAATAFEVFDDGAGAALYVGGTFTQAGGVAASNVARWDGSAWSALGAGTDAHVWKLASVDLGGGPALYAGGEFVSAGGMSANRIAKWDGAAWSNLGSGMIGFVPVQVTAIADFDDGSGSALYAGGFFNQAGGVPARGIARWNGASWSSIGDVSSVFVLSVFDAGAGLALYAGGSFGPSFGGTSTSGLNHVASFDGNVWSTLGSGLHGGIDDFEAFDDGTGTKLFAAGGFTCPDVPGTLAVAAFDGASWSELSGYTNGSAEALEVHDEGSGQALYLAGRFLEIDGIQARRVARWDGASWSALGQGVGSPSGFPSQSVSALAVFDDGGGPELYAGGYWSPSGGGPANLHIAKWNGSSWTVPSGGTNGAVSAFAVFDDGTGTALYVGGSFTTAGGVAANRIARWDGTSWSAVGAGITGVGFDGVVALFVHDDGGGEALYVGGEFTTAGGMPAAYVARWDGTSWSTLGSGMDGPVASLTVFDDGAGPALYAGGSFTSAGGVAANRIAKWDGFAWSALGAGIGQASFESVRALASFNDGGGSALYAGGNFAASAAGDSVLAKWANPPGCGDPGVSFCEPGVAGVLGCACGNPPAAVGLGCNNSSNTGGARLSATGIARLTYDTVVMTTEGEKPTATSIVLQGDNVVSAGLTFGQGVRCVTGSLKRMYVKVASDGAITAPEGTDLPLHERSAELGDVIAPGTRRYYAVYYRDPVVPGGCTGTSTFNVTQQLDVLWEP